MKYRATLSHVIVFLLSALSSLSHSAVIATIDLTGADVSGDFSHVTELTPSSVTFESNDLATNGTGLRFFDYSVSAAATYLLFDVSTVYTGHNPFLGNVNVGVEGSAFRTVQGTFDGTLAIDLSSFDDLLNIAISFPGQVFQLGEFEATISNLRLIDDATVPLGYLSDVRPGSTPILQPGYSIYWSDEDELASSGGRGGVQRVDLDGSSPVNLVPAERSGGPLATDEGRGKIYWGERLGGPPVLYRSNLDGSDLEIFAEGAAKDIEVDPASGDVYWLDGTDEGPIIRSSFDGSTIDTVVEVTGSGAGTVKTFDLDSVNGRIFWMEEDFSDSRPRVFSSALSGEEVQEVATILGGFAVPEAQIAVDPIRQYIYVAAGSVFRTNYAGSAPSVFLTNLRPLDMNVDYTNGELYWSDSGPNAIMKAEINGASRTFVLPNDTGNFVGQPVGFALVIEGRQAIRIDVKPGSDPNCFNINGHGVIPVAVLGAEDFSVEDIDLETLRFGGLEVGVRGNKGPLCSLDYVDSDSMPDLVCQFEDSSDYWEPGDGEAILSGSLYDGSEFEGADSICVVP